MPPMASCTACRPDSAACLDWRATVADCCAWADTALMRVAMSSTDWPVWRISCSWSVEVVSSSDEVLSTRAVVCATRVAVLCTLPTSERSSSTV